MEPPFRPPTEADLEQPSVVAAVRAGTSPTSGVICFQRSLPGTASPEILVHVAFDAFSNRGAGTSSFSGLPLGPPSVSGWSARGVTNSLRKYVAVTPRVRQRIHQAVDRNPWGQASEKTERFSSALDRESVAVWVVNLTPSASCDLLDFKDTVEFDTDCRWIPSTTALAVDTQGGLLEARRVAALQSPLSPTKRKATMLPSARRRARPSRSHRGGRAAYDQAMRLHGYDSSYYRTVAHVYSVAPDSTAAAPPLDSTSLSPPSPPRVVPATPAERWGAASNKGKRGCGNICPTATTPPCNDANSAATTKTTDARVPPPTQAPPPYSHFCMRRNPPAETAPPLTSRVHKVPLPHLATPPLAIFRWHARMASAPPPPMVPTVAAIAALVAEQRTAELFASTTPRSPAPTIVDILKEAGRRARSRGAAQVTPLDVRHAAQLFAPARASLVPPKPFVDPQPEHNEELPDLFEAVHASIDASGHRPPRVLSVGDATGIVANAFRRTGCDVVTIDRLPSEDPTMPHVMGDASDFVDAGFDLVIGQPPCTFLCNAGVVWLHRDPNRFLDMHRGAKFFRRLLDADAPFVALENPAMHRYATAAIGGLRPSQYIHPFEHGHGETKSIGIYADGLPLLLASKLVTGRTHVRASLPQSPQRSAIRGRTYLGVAAAMAIQWTPVLAQHVATQIGSRHGRHRPRSRDDTQSAFDLCLAVASRLDCPLTIRPEQLDQEGILRAVNITIPEEHDDTDADIAAAALVAAEAETQGPRKPEWICAHGRSHSLLSTTNSDCKEPGCLEPRTPRQADR